MTNVRGLEHATPEGIVWVTVDDIRGIRGDGDPLAVPMFSVVPAGDAIIPFDDDSSTVSAGRALAGQPVKAGRARLAVTMTARVAFTVLASNCLAQMQGNETPAKLGNDPEGIHQFRIGLRRLRALVSAFGDMLPAKSHRKLVGELHWLQQELSAVRDWEVFATSTLGPIARRLPDLQYAVAAAHRLQEIAQHRARAALGSPRYAALLLHFHIWLVTGAWASPDAAKKLDEPIGRFAAASLKRRHRRLRKFGGKNAALPESELHRLRMVVKKQRYLCDFLRELYPKKPASRYVAALTDVQDVLGEINDARVAQRLTAELALYMTGVSSIGPSVAAHSAGIVLGGQAAARAERQGDVRRLWKDFRACGKFWCHDAT